MKPLLLLVDLQHDYLAAPGLEPAAGAAVARAGALLEGCRELGVPVAHVWTTVSPDDDRRMPHWKRAGRWICVEGTRGHEPPPPLQPLEGEPVLHKTGFSADTGGLLDDVDVLVVAGVHAHACVRQAAIEAYQRHGLEVWVADDASPSDDPLHAAVTRRYLEQRAARFRSVDDVLASLRAGRAEAGARVSVGQVVARCRAALAPWQAGDRRAVLERLARRLESEAESLGSALADAIHKPVRYGVPEVRRSAEMLRAVSRHAVEAEAEAVHGAEVRHRPLGVVAVITPWNNPVYIPLGKIGPALMFGNAVLWKPAPAAHGIAERVVGMLGEAGVPEGLVGLVPGGVDAARAVLEEGAVDAVTITGSSLAGFAAQEACARRRIPLQAELGGNNAALVWEDADLDLAAREIADGAFAQAGQRCTANRRAVVHRHVAGELLERLRSEAAALRPGDPHDRDTRVGPLVTGELREPAVVACEDPDAELVQEESFAPLLVLQTAGDWEEAMGLVNGVRQGLAAAVFTASSELAERFAEEAAAGIVKVNRSTADAEVDVPFGGWKWSGLGPPEHGRFDRDFYTRPQTVYR